MKRYIKSAAMIQPEYVYCIFDSDDNWIDGIDHSSYEAAKKALEKMQARDPKAKDYMISELRVK